MKGIALLLIAIATSCGLGACHSHPTPQELATVNTLTAHLTTRCVGRYLIDMRTCAWALPVP